MVLYKTKSLDGTKANTNPKTNPNRNTNPIQLFYAVFEQRPMIFKLASFVRFSHHSNTVTIGYWLYRDLEAFLTYVTLMTIR